MKNEIQLDRDYDNIHVELLNGLVSPMERAPGPRELESEAENASCI
jgi:hypothetical protein